MGIFENTIAEVISEQDQKELEKWYFNPGTCWGIMNYSKDTSVHAMVQPTLVGEYEPVCRFMQMRFNRLSSEPINIYKAHGKEALKLWIKHKFDHEFEHWKQFIQLLIKLDSYMDTFFFVTNLYNRYGYDKCPLEIEARKAENGQPCQDLEIFINNLISDNQELFGRW